MPAHAAIDAPHNETNTMSCSSCHDPDLPDSPLLAGSNINNFCTTNCHFEPSPPYTDTGSPKVLEHSSNSTSTKYGVWTRQCTHCHNPHIHGQKFWKNSDANNFYLTKGQIIGYTYNNGPDTTTITYSGANWKAGWSTANITDKTSAQRRPILLPNLKKLGWTFTVTAMNATTMTVKGDLTPAYQYISLPTDFAIILGQYINQYIDADNNGTQETAVKLFDHTGNFSFANDESETGTDPTPSGICQVCHTQTTHWKNDGTGAAIGVHADYNGADCTTCHAHANGFAHGADGTGLLCATASCHDSGKHVKHLTDQISCSGCHDLDNMWASEGVINDPRDPANNAICSNCHFNVDGGTDNHDAGFIAGWTNGGYDLACDGCHDGRPNTTDTRVMSSNGHDRLVGETWIRQYPCYYCHDDSVDAAWNLTAKHGNGVKDVAIADQWKIVGQNPPAYNSGTKVCSNTYCHSDGTKVNPEMRDYPWTGGHEDCNSCHGHDPDETNCGECHAADAKHTWTPEKKWISAMPMYASTGAGTPRANSHFRHLFTGFSCDDCHAATVVGACLDCHDAGIPTGAMAESSHLNGTFHVDVNKTKNVVFKNGGDYDYGSKTCSSTACHSGVNPIWGGSVSASITCLECHGTTGADIDDFGEFNSSQAKINLTQWSTTGHGRPDTGNPETDKYNSGNPPANFPGIGCWYCHDNQVLHQDVDNPFRLRKHSHFENRFQKECVYCHMVGEDSECLGCHDASESLAPQLATIAAEATPLPDYNNNTRPNHTGYNSTTPAGGCAAANCHTSDATRHKTEAGLWNQDQKDDVKNSYVMMGVCLKCHDDDSGGQCESCHTAPADDPGTPAVDESLKYSTGFDPLLPGSSFVKPQQAKASSFHFGYKHYTAYENSVAATLDTGTVSANAAGSLELDSAKTWTVDGWAGKTVMMTSGVSNEESRKIKSNTATKLTLEKGFTSPVQSGETFKIINPVWKGGKFCWDCHDPHGDDNLYMIQNKVATRTDGTFGQPITRSDVVFTNKSTGAGYAKFNAPYNGICNVCHTEGSQHYSATGGDGHNNGRRCTNCHEHRFTDSHSSGKPCDTCHQSKPVPRHAAFGLPRDCTKCHADVVGLRMNIIGQMTAKSHHVQRADGTVKNTDCYQCHWESTDNGLINIEHHEGYNYKTHASTPNAKVDLVIWNGEETAGGAYDDNDPTKGSRPVVYDPDGTDPDGPGKATVTQFLATKISGTLAEQRGEVDKVTNHCLGCHSDQNNDVTPFDDCKTPRQYAWDRSSVGSRYANTDTTTWGKYSGSNVAAKNVTKAFSAHGNAVNNGGGFNTSDGEDKTITNTRNGLNGTRNYNVQCFDCHSSHGSKATGTTSSYTTFNGFQNGGNLKETQGGKGGYLYNYWAGENQNQASINPYKTGAGQCFDCHESANVGTQVTVQTKTPWGYNETFGATAPILGYRDTLKFGQSSRGLNNVFAFKKANIVGGHLKASSALGTPAMSTIGGLCTPCHDPHGVSRTMGDNMQYAVPLLKGTWMTSPYKDDTAGNVADGTSGNNYYRNYQATFGSPEPPIQKADGRAPGGWRSDRNTFNQGDLGVLASHPSQYNRITEGPEIFAGLCLRCHPKSSLTTEASAEATATLTWGEKNRIHRSVKGWGWNDGETPREHSYTCSKCHQPHVSALPRLMKTNCLDYKHRGKVASGGTPGTYSGNYFGKFPFGWWVKGQFSQGSTATCHGAATANGSAGWPANQDWNNITAW